MYGTVSKGIGLKPPWPHDWAAIYAIANPSVGGEESFVSLFAMDHERHQATRLNGRPVPINSPSA
jgi:hypothetical protein